MRRAEKYLAGAAIAGKVAAVEDQGVTGEMFADEGARKVFEAAQKNAVDGFAFDIVAAENVLADVVKGRAPSEVAAEMLESFDSEATLPAYCAELRGVWAKWEKAQAYLAIAGAERDGKPDVAAHWQKRLDEIETAARGAIVIDEPDGENGAAEDEGEEEPVEAVPLPDGIVGETAQWIAERCEKPFLPFALVSSLGVWATLAGRKVRYQNQGTILYGMSVASSSNGKDAPPALARSILGQVGVTPLHFTGRLSSWNAGIEALMRVWFHPASLASVDEAAGYFGGAVGGVDFGLLDFLKAAWSRGMGTIDPQGRTKKAGSATLASIHHPCLSMLLSAQPTTLGDAVRTAQLEDGLLPRALWVVRRRFVEEVNEQNLERSHRLEDTETGQKILHRGRDVWNWLPGQDAIFRDMADLEGRPDPASKGKDGEEADGPMREVWQEPVIFDADDGAKGIFRDFTRRTQSRIRPAAEGAAGPFGFLWGKATENAKRVALTLAAARCAATCGPYTIGEEEARWAVRFVEATVRDGIRWAKENMADTPFQKKANRVLGFIRAAPVGVATRRSITRAVRNSISTKELDEILETLIQSGSVEGVHVRTQGRTAKGYRATDHKRDGRRT